MNHGLIKGLSTETGLIQNWLRIRTGPSYIPAKVFSRVLLDVLQGERPNRDPLDFIATRVESLGPGALRSAMRSLVADAKGDTDQIRQNIEGWYDDAMDRVTGWYKRLTWKMLFAIGLALASLLHVDSLLLAKRLWQDPAVRQAVVEQANAYAQSNPAALENIDVQEIRTTIDKIPLPIGEPLDGDRNKALVLAGWMITALAVSLGAPFWLNGMRTLLSLRAAGPQPSKGAVANVDSSKPEVPRAGPFVPGEGPANEFERSLPEIDLRDVQTVLGLPARHVTGTFTRIMREAVAQFEREIGLVPTGTLTQDLVARIMIA